MLNLFGCSELQIYMVYLLDLEELGKKEAKLKFSFLQNLLVFMKKPC